MWQPGTGGWRDTLKTVFFFFFYTLKTVDRRFNDQVINVQTHSPDWMLCLGFTQVCVVVMMSETRVQRERWSGSWVERKWEKHKNLNVNGESELNCKCILFTASVSRWVEEDSSVFYGGRCVFFRGRRGWWLRSIVRLLSLTCAIISPLWTLCVCSCCIVMSSSSTNNNLESPPK